MSPLSSRSLSSLTRPKTKLQSGANDARSDDTSRLKVAVAEWLNSRMPYQTWLSAKAKEERGTHNDVTGRLLCPIDFDWDDLKYVPALLHKADLRLTIHLVSVQTYEVLLQDTISTHLSSFGVSTRERRGIQMLLRRAS